MRPPRPTFTIEPDGNDPALTPGYLQTLRENRGFRYLFGARTVSLAGDWLSLMAVIALLREVQGSDAAVLSGFFILKMLPIFFAGPLAGVVADRFNRKAIMIVSDLVRATVVVGLLATPSFDRPVELIYGLVLLQVVASAFFEPARFAALPDLVPRAQLSAASALGAMMWSAVFAAGAAAGGLITGFAGWRTALLIDAGTYVFSAWLISRIVLPARKRKRGPAGWRTWTGWADLRDGIRFVRGRPDVASVLGVKAGWGVAGAVTLLLTLLGEGRFAWRGSPDFGVAILFTSRAIGTGIGPWLARRLVPRETPRMMRRLLAVAFVWPALCYGALSIAGSIYTAAACVIAAHLGGSVLWVYSSVLLQKTVPDEYRGRVSSADLGLATLVLATAIWIYGLLAAAGVDLSLLVRMMGASLLLPAVVWWICAGRWPVGTNSNGGDRAVC